MSKRILVIGKEHMLGMGVLSVLNGSEACEVFSEPEAGCDQVAFLTKQYQPDAVVLSSYTHNTLCEHCLDVLNSQAEMKIIVLNYADNFVQLYQKLQVSIGRPADILSII